MLILDATTKSLQINLAASVTTNQLQFSTSYINSTGTAMTPGEQDGTTNNTTAVTVAGAWVVYRSGDQELYHAKRRYRAGDGDRHLQQ